MGGDLGFDILLKLPTASAITCPTGAGTDAMGSRHDPERLTCDATTGYYTYVWKTQTRWKGTCKRLHMPLSDGVDHTALFQFS